MKVSHDFGSGQIDNSEVFSDGFFKRFTPRNRIVDLGGVMEKEYTFPTLYYDTTCAQAIFLCSYNEALKLMPHPGIVPVRAKKDKAVLAISCYIYKNVLGMQPYNEIVLMIAVDAGKRGPILLPLIFNDFSGYYVFSMPVTSRENCLRGNYIWGLPKITQEINFDIIGEEAIITAMEDDGSEYFRLRVPTTGKQTVMDQKTYLFSKINGDIKKAETNFKGCFNVNKNLGVLFNSGKQPESPCLILGNTKSGAAIKRLEIDSTPLQLRYVEHLNACFDFYDENYKLK